MQNFSQPLKSFCPFNESDLFSIFVRASDETWYFINPFCYMETICLQWPLLFLHKVNFYCKAQSFWLLLRLFQKQTNPSLTLQWQPFNEWRVLLQTGVLLTTEWNPKGDTKLVNAFLFFNKIVHDYEHTINLKKRKVEKLFPSFQVPWKSNFFFKGLKRVKKWQDSNSWDFNEYGYRS